MEMMLPDFKALMTRPDVPRRVGTVWDVKAGQHDLRQVVIDLRVQASGTSVAHVLDPRRYRCVGVNHVVH